MRSCCRQEPKLPLQQRGRVRRVLADENVQSMSQEGPRWPALPGCGEASAGLAQCRSRHLQKTDPLPPRLEWEVPARSLPGLYVLHPDPTVSVTLFRARRGLLKEVIYYTLQFRNRLCLHHRQIPVIKTPDTDNALLDPNQAAR